MATEHYCFVNPYCSCVLSDDQYPNIANIMMSSIASSICNCMCNVPVTKTVPEYPVPRTGLCIVMLYVHVTVRVCS